MGIDYTPVIIYGKKFESLNEAIEFLLESVKITEEQAEESECSGEICGTELEWEQYTCYSNKGVLGSTYSARTLYTEPEQVTKRNAYTDELLGDGCAIHEFVKVW